MARQTSAINGKAELHVHARQRSPLAPRSAGARIPTIAQVDSEAHAATAGLFDVKGYPTLKWMPKGKTSPGDAETVSAPRTADGLGQWITDKTGVKARKPAEVCFCHMVRLFLPRHWNSMYMWYE